MKIFTEADIDKNIEGFSDTTLKRFLLRVGIDFDGDKDSIDSSILSTFLSLIENGNDFVEFITFMDMFHRNCKIFKFAGALNWNCVNGDSTHKQIYQKCFHRSTKNDSWIVKKSKQETHRLETLLHISRPEEFIYLQSKSETYEDIKNSIISVEKRKKEIKYGVHASHCCFIHGCKYGDDDCPVEKGVIKQEYICESCENDGVNSIDELEAMLVLGLKKCSECGHYYKVEN